MGRPAKDTEMQRRFEALLAKVARIEQRLAHLEAHKARAVDAREGWEPLPQAVPRSFEEQVLTQR